MLIVVLLGAPAACVVAVSRSQPQDVMPRLTEADKQTWRTTLKVTVMRPPCCGACGLFTMSDAKEIWGYLTGTRVTARGQELWRRHARKLLAEFSHENPERYKRLYAGLKISGKDPL